MVWKIELVAICRQEDETPWWLSEGEAAATVEPSQDPA